MTQQNVTTDVLRTIHRIHRQLSDLEGRLQRGPQQTRAAEAYVKHSEQQLAKVRDEAKAMRMATDAKQVRLKAGEDKIKELSLKLNAAGSNREYQALKDQIAAQKVTNGLLDDEILEGWERADELKRQIAQADEVLQKAREKLEHVRTEVNRQEPLIREDLSRLRDELEETEASLPVDLKEMYGRVVRQRGEDALAAVENQICSGCHQQVPLNVCAEIMLAHPMFCRSCGRLLYMPEGHTLG
jgi:predicted  nucleic acid-binding Zn-ribbon protein